MSNEMYQIPKVVPITDAHGNAPRTTWHADEPEPGSVVLVHGPHGTAYQRWASDGLWHRTGNGHIKPKPWAWLLTQPRVVLVYPAPKREADRQQDVTVSVRCANPYCTSTHNESENQS